MVDHRHESSSADHGPNAERPGAPSAAGPAPATLLPARPVEVLVPEPRRLRIALAHDWLCGVRGGEHVLERIAALVLREHRLVAVFTMFDDGRPVGRAVDSARKIIWPYARSAPLTSLRRWMLPFYPSAIASLSRSLGVEHRHEPIDLVLSTSSAAMKSLRAPEGVPHLCYCHSPARYLWSRRGEYERGARAVGLRLLGPSLRRWDAATAANVTAFVANSSYVAGEIRNCYQREAAVVHPPVRTDFFTPGAKAREDHWLFVGAIEPYKRLDLAMRAAEVAGKPLRVVGDGTERRRLERIAPPDCRFLGRIGDEQLRDEYRAARLLIFPQVEDFGIVAAEALACGLPVVARAAGGALDIVSDGATGALFSDPEPASIAATAARCPPPGPHCRAAALRFSESAFDEAMRRQIAALAR